jgi:hypothetical protein
MFTTAAVEHAHGGLAVDDIFRAHETVFAASRADDLIRHGIVIGGRVSASSVSQRNRVQFARLPR